MDNKELSIIGDCHHFLTMQKIILILILIVLILITVLFVSFPLRHYLGMNYLQMYPVSIAILKNDQGVQTSLGEQEIKTAPTARILLARINKTLPPYAMEIEVKTENGQRGNARIMAYSLGGGSPAVMTYTLNWQFDGRVRDLFGSYIYGFQEPEKKKVRQRVIPKKG